MHNTSQKEYIKQNYSLNIAGNLLVIDKPLVMAIVNITTDSFWKGNCAITDNEIQKQIEKLLDQGADIIDLGGYSTRPGAQNVPTKEELDRLLRAVKTAKKIDPNIILSIDSFRSDVVKMLYETHGAFIVNDISGGTIDENIMTVAGQHKLPYIIGHIKGTPQTMALQATYDEPIVNALIKHFTVQINKAHKAGILDIIIDPCFGFAKTVTHNYSLLKHFNQLKVLGYPLLAALSRKSMIYKTLETTPDDALIGTAALHFEALKQGAKILRVHDTREAVQIIKLFDEYENAI